MDTTKKLTEICNRLPFRCLDKDTILNNTVIVNVRTIIGDLGNDKKENVLVNSLIDFDIDTIRKDIFKNIIETITRMAKFCESEEDYQKKREEQKGLELLGIYAENLIWKKGDKPQPYNYAPVGMGSKDKIFIPNCESINFKINSISTSNWFKTIDSTYVDDSPLQQFCISTQILLEIKENMLLC